MATRKKPELSASEERARRVLNLLVQLTDLSDGAVADRCGWSRQRVEQRRKGETRMRIADVDTVADAFGVNPLLFSLEADEALHYLANNYPDLVNVWIGWLSAA